MKKLTKKEIENRQIKQAIKRIKTIEKSYGKNITRSACQRYANYEREQLRLQKDIKEKENQLQKLKNKKS